MSEFSGTVRNVRRFAAATSIIVACPAHGGEVLCRDIPELSSNSSVSLGHVASGTARVHFVKDASAQPGCPDRMAACVERAYVVPGDRVILGARQDPFVCTTYLNASGVSRSGWLPADSVAYDKAERATLAAWLGKWSRVEADILVKAGRAGALLIEGDATYGALDPGRVKRGAVNSGSIGGEVTPAGDRLSFAMGDSATLPVDKGDEFSCKVWMQRVGPWLIVNDNNNCGGFNVTFRGIYTRKP